MNRWSHRSRSSIPRVTFATSSRVSPHALGHSFYQGPGTDAGDYTLASSEAYAQYAATGRPGRQLARRA
ncbi:hypothetical protein ACQEVF_52940 [Nonomuraea polychroma]|uniref:hypothetical protein n=1 Tax=Nonomuraea polychroma TaxID=46176 RepID=UPI003D92AE05